MEKVLLRCSFLGCSKTFNKLSRLRDHTLTHNSQRPFLCNVDGCSKKYSRAQHLARHKAISHEFIGETDEQDFQCTEEKCKKVFKTKQALKKHFSTVHGEEKPYKCTHEACQYAFHKKHQLKAHLFDHQGCLPFQCSFQDCQKQFKQMSHLQRHLKVHKGYACDETDCVEVFATWTLLRKHKSINHKSKAAYVCNTCGKPFAQKSALNNHNKTHEVTIDGKHVSRLLCPKEGCESVLSTRRTLQEHLRKFHQEIVETYQKQQKMEALANSIATAICGRNDYLDHDFKLPTKVDELAINESGSCPGVHNISQNMDRVCLQDNNPVQNYPQQWETRQDYSDVPMDYIHNNNIMDGNVYIGAITELTNCEGMSHDSYCTPVCSTEGSICDVSISTFSAVQTVNDALLMNETSDVVMNSNFCDTRQSSESALCDVISASLCTANGIDEINVNVGCFGDLCQKTADPGIVISQTSTAVVRLARGQQCHVICSKSAGGSR